MGGECFSTQTAQINQPQEGFMTNKHISKKSPTRKNDNWRSISELANDLIAKAEVAKQKPQPNE